MTIDPPIYIYIKRINNRLVFKLKDVYKLELQTQKTINLLSSKKESINQTKNCENVWIPEVVEVVLVQCNLVDNDQQKSQLLYTFMASESYTYLLNVELRTLVFLKTYNSEFDDIILSSTDPNDRSSEIEDKISLILHINRKKEIFKR